MKSKLVHHKKNKMYMKIFMFLVLCIVIIIFLTSSILYINFERIALNTVYSSTMNSLEQTSKDAAIMAQTGITLTNQLNRDMTIAKLLYYDKPNVYEIQSALAQLQSYSQVMQFINSIYVYNDNLSVMYVGSTINDYANSIQNKQSFDDKGILSIIKDYKKYKPFSPIPRTFSINSSPKQEINCYTFLGYSWLDSGDFLKGAVIVNISEEWLHSIINNNEKIAKVSGNTFIIDAAGKVISNSQRFPMMSDLSDMKYIKEILNSNANGYSVNDIGGIKSFITYTSSDDLGWRYIRIIPYNSITRDIQMMRINTIIITLAILLTGFLFSLISAKILYKPIEKIEVNLSLLEKEKRVSFYTLKQDFLRKIILNSTECKTENIFQKFQQHGICLNGSGMYYIAILKIDQYSDFIHANITTDRNILKYGIMNIASEICSQKFKTEPVDMNDDSMVLILNSVNTDNLLAQAEFMNLFREVQEAVLKHLELSLTVAVNPIGNELSCIHDLYNKAAETSLHRLFYGHGSIIFADEVLSYESKEYLYPTKTEQLMQDALMKGEIEKAKNLYLQIINESAEFPYSIINIVISRLVLTLNLVLNTIQKNHSLDAHPSVDLLFIQMNGVETIEEVHQRFFKAFDDISSIILEKKSSKHDAIIDKINDIISSRYLDPTLSVENIADSLMMSSTHISRLYKQNTLKTILEAIIEVRMEESRKLLLDTDLSIASIAEMTGFSSDSYFYKTFKKKNGITPADYRKNSVENV